jgi:esterase/lipase superfamily enzyme
MTTVYFGTNRKPNRKSHPTDFGGEFSDDGLANLRFGEADVDAEGKVGSIEVYRETPSGSELGSTRLFNDLLQKMRGTDSDVLIFLHGFNVSFHEALSSAARIVNTFRVADEEELAVVVFSWPSNGEVTHYVSDRHDAQASGLAVARGLTKVIQFLHELDRETACDRKIHLLAHSMGNYVLRWALQELQNLTPRSLPRLLDEVVLAAADEDDDAFETETKLARLPELARRINVYFNRGDRALAGSTAKGNPDRLGTDGPRDPRSVHAKAVLIDCSDVVQGGLEHSYYVDSLDVANDIRHVLSGVSPDNRELNRQYVPHQNHFRITRG